MKKYLHTQIAESSIVLPSVVIVSFVVWIINGVADMWWLQCSLMAATIYAIVELNNSNVLIRVRSRMTSSVFLLYTSIYPAFFTSIRYTFVVLCLTIFLLLLFHSYQDKTSVRLLYYSHILLGIASLFYVQILLFIPLFWLLALTNIQSLTFRTWMASLLGILTPYWLLLPLLLYRRDISIAEQHFQPLFHYGNAFDFSLFTAGQLFTAIIVWTLGTVGAIHFLRFNYEDRIRTRQLFGFFAWTTIFATFLLFLQPDSFDPLMRIIILCLSTFTAHYFSLTRTRLAFIIFIAGVIAITLAIIFNLASPMAWK